tara:strand:- start:433 stop:852 length:420 start_codon:yes stop_codon:yes gene_type:complete
MSELIAASMTTDTIVGQTSAGSITVRGEGSNNTNLQQGLSKKWLYFKGTTTTEIKDSFNCASISDNGTGDTSTNMTTAFSSAFYSVTGSAHYSSTNYPRSLSPAGNDAINTTYVRIYSGTNSGLEDLTYNMLSIDGDLA